VNRSSCFCSVFFNYTYFTLKVLYSCLTSAGLFSVSASLFIHGFIFFLCDQVLSGYKSSFKREECGRAKLVRNIDVSLAKACGN